MDSASSEIKVFFVQLASAQVLTEIIAIVVAAVLAVVGGRYAHMWLQRSGRSDSPTWLGASLEAVVIAAPMFIGVVALSLLHLLLSALGFGTELLYLALELTLALALVRLAAYCMRLMLGRHTWFDAWEGRIAFAIWVVIALELVGWLERIQATLDHVHLIPGHNMLSLWGRIKGIVVFPLFVLMPTWAPR